MGTPKKDLMKASRARKAERARAKVEHTSLKRARERSVSEGPNSEEGTVSRGEGEGGRDDEGSATDGEEGGGEGERAPSEGQAPTESRGEEEDEEEPEPSAQGARLP